MQLVKATLGTSILSSEQRRVDQLYIGYNVHVSGNMSKPKTEMPSNLSFDVSYANSTFLIVTANFDKQISLIVYSGGKRFRQICSSSSKECTTTLHQILTMIFYRQLEYGLMSH